MDLSFIILAWNSEKHIGACLSSLIDELAATGLSSEVFVVDNGSRDATASIVHALQNKYPGIIKLISFEDNKGTTHSRNEAIKLSSGRYVGIMDSDIEIRGSVVKELVRVLDADASVGLVAPKLIYPNGQLQKSVDRFPTLASKMKRYLLLKAIERDEGGAHKGEAVRPVDYAISAFWLLKRSVIDKVGLFDENIFYSPEDVDYCLRLWKAGYRVVYDARINAMHHAQEISRGFRMNSAFFLHLTGLMYYFSKHRYCFRAPTF